MLSSLLAGDCQQHNTTVPPSGGAKDPVVFSVGKGTMCWVNEGWITAQISEQEKNNAGSRKEA
jgi:hypothetical protein